MEEIQQFLGKDEKILWNKISGEDRILRNKTGEDERTLWNKIQNKARIMNYIALPLIAIALLALAFRIFIIAIIFTLLFFIIYVSGVLILVFMEARHFRRIRKIFNLSNWELGKYKKISILTNKRWIQKNIDMNRYIYPKDFPPDTIERNNDIIFVNLNAVKAVMVAESDPKNYRIWIYLKEPFTEYDDPHIGVEIKSWGEYDKFMHCFKQFVLLGEPREEISYGVKFIHYIRQ